MEFLQSVLREINNNIPNNYSDNWDSYRYGPPPKKAISLKQKVKNFLNKKNYYNLHELVSNSAGISKFEYLYNNLQYEQDKHLLVQVLAYRILGYTKVKLPLNNPDYWNVLKDVEQLTDKSDNIKSGFLDIPLTKFNLAKIGFPIEFYHTELGVMIDFVVKQYEYNKNGTLVKAEQGDIVIDGGGCWGDTALYFSNEVGASGKVYTFEFIPNNLKLMRKNLSLNKSLEANIEILERPLWNETNTKLYFKDFGPGSEVRSEPFEAMDGECLTINIDSLVSEKNIQKVDFIKMDIEGAETNALKGAINTIKRFKPKLAITLYHSIEDFERIPKLINEMVPEYKFYFSHCTIYSEESLLFAEVEK